MRRTPPPLRRRAQADALAEEVRALADRSAELLGRIDELCGPTNPTSGAR